MAKDIKKVWASDKSDREIAKLKREGWEVYAEAPAVTHLRRDKGYRPPKPKKAEKAEE